MNRTNGIIPKLYLLFGLLLILLGTSGCFRKATPYSFFVAGHTYGVKEKAVSGMHMPFVADFPYLTAYPDLQFGVLTGDIVYYSRDTSWNAVDRQLADVPVPVYFAVGNHDEGHKSPYKERYGDTYFAFEQGRDLCLVLNPGLGGWNIWRDQYAFLEAQLGNAKKYDHVFIFFHQLLWWTKDNQYRRYSPNSLDGRTPETNFWTEVMPLLEACDKPVYCFAGDVGAAGKPTRFFADQVDNVHFIASGMGNGIQDNYLFVQVDPEQGVRVMVRMLQQEQDFQVFPATTEMPIGASTYRQR